MTELSTHLAGDVQQIADIAAGLAEPKQLGTDPMVYVLPEGYSTEVIDPEAYQAQPARKRGTVKFTDALSFQRYVAGHKVDGTTLWADAKVGKLISVIDDHAAGAGSAGWGDHRARLDLEVTEDWALWTKHDGKPMKQATFAEFVEDAAPTIRQPAAAEMLEIAQSFKAHTNVRFESGKRVTNGETQLTYIEETTATAGRKGSVEVPEVVVLGIAPWTSCVQGYELRARLRYRITEGELILFYRLDRPDDVLRAAFADVLAGVEEETGLTAYHGTPR